MNKFNYINLNQINKLILQICPGLSGNNFLESILDYHPDLLTVPLHSMADFHFIYNKYLKNKNIKDIIIQLKQSHLDKILKLFISSLYVKSNFSDYSSFIDKFSQLLHVYFKVDYIPTELELFKFFFLSTNYCQGRSFDKIPAIYFSRHPCDHPCAFSDYYNIYENFKEFISLMIIRRPSVALAASVNMNMRNPSHNNSYRKMIYNFIQRIDCYLFGAYFVDKSTWLSPVLFKKDFKLINSLKAIKFEDLKLNPKNTLLSLCQALNIKFCDTLLKSTINNFPFIHDNYGQPIKDFDKSPIYNYHNTYFSNFDHYRIEILFKNIYKKYNYNFKFYTGYKYSKNDIINLFNKKFKFEEEMLKKNDIDTSPREDLINTITKYLNNSDDIESELIPAKLISPLY